MSEQAREIRVPVLPKQTEFLQAPERRVLYSGAFGAGKTRAVCLKAAIRAATPGAREGLFRKHLVTFKATTLKTLLEPDGDLPPVLPAGYYTHNKNEKTIKIHGGGEIVYAGIDDQAKIGSYQLTGAGVDEAVELQPEDWTQLDGRCRVKVEGLSNQLYGACNPGPPSHFLAEIFGLAMGHQPDPNCRAVTTRAHDNFYLPRSYLDALDSFTGVARARYVDGIWAGSEGLVYDTWDRLTHVQQRSEKRWRRCLIGQDEGYTNPACMLVGLIDGDDRLHIAEEWYKTRQLETDVIEAAKHLHQHYQPEAFWLDPSSVKLREAMREAGLPAREPDNEVFGGIQRVQKRLAVAGDGSPRLTVDPSCENLIREFETYEWKPVEKGSSDLKDEPVKANDHAMDALRYMIAGLDGSSSKWDAPPAVPSAELSQGYSGMMEPWDA